MFFHHINVGSHHLYKSLQWDGTWTKFIIAIPFQSGGVIMSSNHFRSQCQVGWLVFKIVFKNSSKTPISMECSHLPLTYQSFYIFVSFRQTFAGFEVGFRSLSGTCHYESIGGEKTADMRHLQGNKPHKHQVVDDKEHKWDYHIQHSNKLIYSGQHFLQTLLQTQDLGEISEISI